MWPSAGKGGGDRFKLTQLASRLHIGVTAAYNTYHMLNLSHGTQTASSKEALYSNVVTNTFAVDFTSVTVMALGGGTQH